MRVLARGNRGTYLDPIELAKSGNLATSRFSVEVGSTYHVFAMALWAEGLGVLLVTETARPHWFPLGLFSVLEPSLTAGWQFCIPDDPRDPARALWGYPSMVSNANHREDLIDRRRPALKVFLDECEGSVEANDEVTRARLRKLRDVLHEG